MEPNEAEQEARAELAKATEELEAARAGFLAASRRRHQIWARVADFEQGSEPRLAKLTCATCGEVVWSRWHPSPDCKIAVFCRKCRPNLTDPGVTEQIRKLAK